MIIADCNYLGVCMSNNLGKYGLLMSDQVMFHVFFMNLFFILLKYINNFWSDIWVVNFQSLCILKNPFLFLNASLAESRLYAQIYFL